MLLLPPRSTLFPYTTLFRSLILDGVAKIEFWSLITRGIGRFDRVLEQVPASDARSYALELNEEESHVLNLFKDRKSTRLNSSHTVISYAVFCLKKKKKIINK